MEYRDVCFEIENDEFYREYLLNDKPNFEEDLNATEKVNKLTKGIEKLNSELESQVLSKHHDLLTQASHATNLEKVIGSMHIDAQSLLTGIEKLRSQVLIPYNVLESQTIVLERIQKVCHIMRDASKIVQLCKVIPELNGDSSAQANLLYTIEQLLGDNDFSGIDFLVEHLQVVAAKKHELVENASHQLYKGLNSGDKHLLLSSFKVFTNLHCAKEKIDDVVASVLKDVTQAIKSAFDIRNTSEPKKQGEQGKAGPGKANVMNMQSYRVRFWENMEKLFNENLYLSCKKIILLQNSFNDLRSFESFHNFAKSFWAQLSITFSVELRKTSGYANQCVEVDFPKLLKCYNDLTVKLHYKDFEVQRDLLSSWENYFLSKSLEKLLDPVRAMWNTNQVPKSEDIDAAVRIVSAALSVSLGDKQLSIALATSIAKSVKQMSTEAEQRVCLDNDVGQIVEAPSTSQQRNADISNALYYFTTQITRVITNMSSILQSESVSIIQNSLKDISNILILQPFCISINSAVDLILGSMHSETELNRSDFPENVTYSLYLRELQQFITRCKEIYLSLYRDAVAVNKCCEDIATHCIKIFVQNVCSLRPVSDYGRNKLQVDCKQLEIALKPLVSDLTSLDCYREVKALSALLNLTPSEILDSQSKGGSLPHSLVMMMLFSYGGPDLISPHRCAGWSHHKLISWLIDHPNERERLEFIAGALQRYQSHIRQNNISKYDDVYPILLQLLEDGRKQC